MKLYLSILFTILMGYSAMAQSPEIQQLLDEVGIKPTETERGQMDTIGFAFTAQQMDQVTSQAAALVEQLQAEKETLYIPVEGEPLVAAVCPHDDYAYAGQLYQQLIPNIDARRVVIFGVFHKARVFNAENVLVFDSFDTWRGPYGPVKVSSLREKILKRLPEADYVVNNDMQVVEHSVEAIVPWLQHYNRDVEIVSILVPYMNWETMDRLANDLSEALAAIISEKDWNLGEDIAFISSADAVHYGDVGWGGSNFAELGTDIDGYRRAVTRDKKIIEDFLTGPVQPGKLEGFLYSCASEEDVKQYKITWCGRFSIPFGLLVASQVVQEAEERPMTGFLVDYGTSVSEASLEVDGIGVTAPNNLHHWVGYAAIGYR